MWRQEFDAVQRQNRRACDVVVVVVVENCLLVNTVAVVDEMLKMQRIVVGDGSRREMGVAFGMQDERNDDDDDDDVGVVVVVVGRSRTDYVDRRQR